MYPDHNSATLYLEIDKEYSKRRIVNKKPLKTI